MHRRLAIVTSLLFLLWASVACSTKPAGETAEASATSHIFGSEQVTLPAGTVVTVRLASAVGSKLSANGDHFSATVVRPVEAEGKVVVPAGTEALGRVVEAVPQGRFKGAAVLRLVLESVTVKNDSYDVKTNSVSRYLKVRQLRSGADSALDCLAEVEQGFGIGSAFTDHFVCAWPGRAKTVVLYRFNEHRDFHERLRHIVSRDHTRISTACPLRPQLLPRERCPLRKRGG